MKARKKEIGDIDYREAENMMLNLILKNNLLNC